YRMAHGPLAYGRLGVVGSSFDTSYQTASGKNFGGREDLLGFRVGGGLEMPAGDGFFLRMDYSYTSYSDYDISPPPGVDNFANSESLVRLGVGYRFGEEESDEGEVGPTYDPAGFYLGGQGGIASLFSNITGPRSNNAGNSILDADYSDEGLNLGLFGGWGESYQRLYLGLEGEIEGGSAQPDLERLDEGRRFSVDKQFGVGLNLRLGYALGEAGMVYLRGGPVWARFETDYAVGNTTSISDSDNQLGWRGGVGLETPLGEDLFLRLDYSYTAYDDFDVAYGAMGEVDNFDNSESLFRVGVGWRF
ncbi:MAG: outer membrane beta-barrel protein, partial [Limibacillus sp.]